MKDLLALLIAAACLAMFGCGKHKEPGAATSSDDSASPARSQPGAGKAPASDKPLPPAPVYVTAHAQNAPAENVVGVVDPFLTEQLRIFIQQKGRMPQSFAELASARLDSIPNPPLGKKWVIDNTTKEVKAAQPQ